jgi:hypothetical protein
VDAARARLAELEAGFTTEKAKVEAMKARLFARLREHFRRRDRLRLVIGHRRKYLESLVRQGEEEAGKIAQEYRQASAQQEQEYAETAAEAGEAVSPRPLRARAGEGSARAPRAVVRALADDTNAMGLQYPRARELRSPNSLCGEGAAKCTRGACATRKSSACWRRPMRSRRAPITSCTG